MKTAYLSLGSNLGNREENLRRALDLLREAGVRVAKSSSIYETEPQDVREQPWFLNMVIEVETALFPKQLLGRIHKIERELGRKRTVPKGPRTIDIDILLYGSLVMDSAELEIPHPRMAERRFVLEPLQEIAPGILHPVTTKTVREMLGNCVGQQVIPANNEVDK
ncbi:MAG: 2-amino-4-hydroxy-6-hydroxymethyldihydropteridine diphosphokinase [Acidobacteriota bacterium]|nr:2-amino-4-hydroxy-6-hydroxymethyldihydropteridine diphosphokinase [Acidobacteriota bacterium]